MIPLRRETGRPEKAEGFIDTTAMHLRRDLPALTARVAADGRAAWGAMRHPATLAAQARKLSLALPMVRQAVGPILTGHVRDWRAEYAYTAGLQAFVYGFPYIYNAQLRHDWVTEPRNPDVVPYAAVNHFWHAARLLDEGYRDGGCPNTDTLYSLAWIDLRDGPVILSHPDMGDRYFTFELMAFTSDNVDYVGQRTTGAQAGHFALIGPDWRGKLPAEVKATQPSPTPWVLVLGRTLVDGPSDVPAAKTLQAKYRLTPLSRWGKPGARSQRRNVYAPAPKTDLLSPWKTLNAMLVENPPPAHHAVVLAQLARIGIGPGLDVEQQPTSVKQGLTRAALVGMEMLKQQFLSGDWATTVNGWRYPPSREGRFGDDFLSRAADQSMAGITANDPAEAVYLVNFDDAKGTRLSPQGQYELHFDADQAPPVDAFWSLSAYTSEDMNLIPNPSHRYSVGDRTPGLQRDDDGGLTIYLQPQPPDGHETNWLPTSAHHAWFVILRLYRPRNEVVDATWKCPGITRVS